MPWRTSGIKQVETREYSRWEELGWGHFVGKAESAGAEAAQWLMLQRTRWHQKMRLKAEMKNFNVISQSSLSQDVAPPPTQVPRTEISIIRIKCHLQEEVFSDLRYSVSSTFPPFHCTIYHRGSTICLCEQVLNACLPIPSSWMEKPNPVQMSVLPN